MEVREMNFYDLCAACVRGIGRACLTCWKGLVALLRLSWRKWWIVLPVVVLVLGVANYYCRRDNRIYKVEALVWLNGPSTEQTEQVFKRLAYALPDYVSDTQTLPAMLGLTPDELKSVRQLEAFHVIDCLNDSIADRVDYKHKASRLDTVSVHMPNRLCLSFRTKNPSMAPKVGEAIIAYLNRDPKMQAAYERKRIVMERRVDFVKNHIEKLDSLTTAFYFEQGNGTAQIQGHIWQPGFVVGKRQIELFSEDIYNEFDRYDKYSHDLAFCTAPVVLEDQFTINPTAVNSRIKVNFIGLIIGWLLACLIAAIIEQYKSLAAWLNR